MHTGISSRCNSTTTAELNILDGVTATTAELNILGGGTSASSTTVADADRVVLNDNGTMQQVAVTNLSTYFNSKLSIPYSLFTIKDSANLDSYMSQTTKNLWTNPTNYNITYTASNANSYAKIEWKIGYKVSPQAAQRLSFRVLKGNSTNDNATIIFQDFTLGETMGVNSRNVYSGSYIFKPGDTNETTYYIQYKVLDPADIGITSDTVGILGNSHNMYNQIFINELYVP